MYQFITVFCQRLENYSTDVLLSWFQVGFSSSVSWITDENGNIFYLKIYLDKSGKPYSKPGKFFHEISSYEK